MNSTDDESENLIIIDLEDTCLDTLSGFIRWLAKQNRLTSVTSQAITDRDNLGPWLGINEDLAHHWMRDFCEQSWEWGTLLPYYDSNKVIPHIVKEGWEFVGVARGSAKLDRGILRRANTEIFFPNVFKEFYSINLDTNIYPLLKDFEQSVFVTANESVAKSAASAGHITYLLDQPWNRQFNSLTVKRVKSWQEIYFAVANLRDNLA